MRIDVKKFLFVGVEEDRNEFFSRAQEAGIIHFISGQPLQGPELPEEQQRLIQAIKILRGLPVVPQEETEEFEIASGLAQKIIGLKQKIDALNEELRIMRLEISRVEMFGDFSLDEIAYIEKEGKRKIQFFCAKQGAAEKGGLPPEVIYIGSDHGLDYFVSINKESRQYPKMVEMTIEQPWGDLKKRYAALESEMHALDQRLKGYAKYNAFLHHAFVHSLNQLNLSRAKKSVEFPLVEGKLFVVQGWVPQHKMEALQQLVSEMKVHVEEIAFDPKDVVPTYLENEGLSRIGEDLIHIYDTPSTTDKDPSFYVLFFFSLFFAMIIGDGGYGLVLLLIALYLRYKYWNLKGVKRRVLDLVTILAFACIVWGVLTTSFFGISIAPDNPIRKTSLMTWLVGNKAEYHIQHHDTVYKEWVKKYPKLEGVTDPKQFLMDASHVDSHGVFRYEAFNKFSDNILMEAALFVGVLHIIISMSRTLRRNWSHLGWIIFLIGAYLYLPSFLGVASFVNYVFGIRTEDAAYNGLYLMIGGIAIAVVIALFRHKFLGLLEASVMIQIFGDVLSYLRLYALGLAGSLLTATMIDLAASVPLVIGIIILVFGHVVNIALGIMGGIIHGLRLNFLEWYHYCFEGGGRMFNPLRKLKIE